MIDPSVLKRKITKLYGSDRTVVKRQMHRWNALIVSHREKFSEPEVSLFSTPGRTEIGGNHTDHNHGRVLAASINLDSIAVAAKTSDSTITIYSEGYARPFIVELNDLSPVDGEKGTTAALIRGIASRCRELGFQIGGFQACITSDVLVGSGLSSSASVEVLIATILSTFYNTSSIGLQEIALIGQYAENVYFGKPCGLMDQTACAVGGIITIDFKDPDHPKVRKVPCDFSRGGLSLLVVDTGGDHADLTGDYAAIPREMRLVAKHFGKEYCREVDGRALIADVRDLRKKVGDRAVLRALHFLDDNRRVEAQVEALRKNDFRKFLRIVNESGNSSFRWLQNCYTPRNVEEQGVSLALALTERYLEEIGRGACRVHGGGFAGTIQVFLPKKHVRKYVALMESAFTGGCVKELSIRMVGTVQL